MTKIVPFDKNYNAVDKVEFISNFILILSIILSVGTFVLFNVKVEKYEGYGNILNSINCILTVAYFIADVAGNYLFQRAENKRRNDFFDNSLNTKFSVQNSQDYFTNDNIAPGINKLGVNSFENSFITFSVAEKMLTSMVIKSIIIFLVFISLAVFTNQAFIITVLQWVLPYTIIQRTIRLFVFKERIREVFNRFQTIYTTINANDRNEPILYNTTTYETILSWACIKLDSKTFDKMNPSLSTQWTALKTRYNI